MRKMTHVGKTLAATALLLAVPAAAQSADALLACARIARDSDRLACFDAEVANGSVEARRISGLRAAESARIAAEEAAVTAAAGKARAEAEVKARREAFGGEAIGKQRVDPAEVQSVETTLTEELSNPSGLAVYVLGNGQIWRQVDTVNAPRSRPGDAVVLARAPLGGYRLTFTRTKRWISVRRMK